LILFLVRKERKQKPETTHLSVVMTKVQNEPIRWNEVKNVEIKEKLGGGHFGIVYRGEVLLYCY